MVADPDQFRSFEQDNSLFDWQINGVPIWERIRFKVWRDIKRQHGMGQVHTGIDKDLSDYIQGGLLFAKNLVVRNPFLADESDILFVGHQRRKQEPDGYWWDIYLDPIHQHCEYEYVHFEFDRLLEHLSPAKTDNLRYLDLIEYGSTIQRLLGVNRFSPSKGDQDQLKQVEKKISRKFNTETDLTDKVQIQLENRKQKLWLYKILLSRVDPEIVVIVVGYGKETLIEACHEQEIPVVEFQHGVIYQNHFGYSYPESQKKKTFPDYLLVWGEFWKEKIEFSIPDERIIPVGYPYLEQSVEEYKKIASTDQILFISQGTIGEELSKFALELDQHPDIGHDIVYKLHPGEYNRWRDEYPWLVDAGFRVIDSSEPPLYELFAESSVQIGVGSTAVYEGLAFGLKTFVYDCNGSAVLEPLVGEGSAVLVSSAGEVASALEDGRDSRQSFEKEHYFKSNATEEACNQINHLHKNATIYKN